MPIRTVLWAEDALRERFVAENPAGLSPELLALVASWRYRRMGTFFLWKYYKKHTVFLTDSEAFTVLGLYSRLDEIMAQPPPILIDAVLLPFGDRIVYDGLIGSRSVVFGSGIRRSLAAKYRAFKDRGLVRTSLAPAGVPRRATRSRMHELSPSPERCGTARVPPTGAMPGAEAAPRRPGLRRGRRPRGVGTSAPR